MFHPPKNDREYYKRIHRLTSALNPVCSWERAEAIHKSANRLMHWRHPHIYV